MNDERANQETSREASPPQQAATASVKKKAGNPTVTWVIRLVVFGTLAVLLGLAGYDFYLKRQYEQSHFALEDNKQKQIDDQLTRKEVEDELLVGNWEAVDGKNSAGLIVKIYKWKGPFRTYRIQVRYNVNSETVFDWTSEADSIEE